ncbi:HAD family hydrolase [Dongia soli]|uniref:HAD family hydrolase n=1 Tax=Dongia soli TaxID=600628 RepID=A0ABU5E7S2_9PROT|nr:HAD family hydrolase [Dongia soli]MDY0882233.1 HAD family hydrolase [Dongia soli]
MTKADLAATPHLAGLIIFDCDGVLIDSEWIACEVEAEVLSEHGFPMTADDVRRLLLGISTASSLIVLEREYGRRPSAEIMGEVKCRLLDAFTARLDVVPGIREVLTRLPGRRCVASSSDPERLRHCLGLVGLYDDLTPHIFSATMVRNGKPAPDLFLHAAAQMQVAPADCVVVEDSVAGVTGARAAGMTAIGFIGGRHCGPGHGAQLREAGAHRIVQNYDQFLMGVSGDE